MPRFSSYRTVILAVAATILLFKGLSTLLLASSGIVVASEQPAGAKQKPLKPRPAPEPPYIGFGTWNLDEESDDPSLLNASEAVAFAIHAGYRHIDCAPIYGNERSVGRGIAEGIKKSRINREHLWVTSKLWNDRHGDDNTVAKALESTLDDLDLDYLDLYLLHWPVNDRGAFDFVETWKSMEKLVELGKVKHIGVANFSPKQLRKLFKAATIKPAVHQMEIHPYLQQPEWIIYHKTHNIHVTAYSPLANMNPVYHGRSRRPTPPLLENPDIVRIGELRHCTPAQVVLAWANTRGTSAIPKSRHEQWIRDNLDAGRCRLLDKDMHKIDDDISSMYMTRFNNPSKKWGVKLFEGLDDA
ncbi:NADP-dependent oxidoreductase domain-containing protein [Phyllosticta citrichinensis]|uniref:NADP-dependent oxidoreductase domain-containing protein n=1 Tax=Phyllosticta citrichinensis TaxID=1130410 RepID=A0ABR1XTJ8_9PEZI